MVSPYRVLLFSKKDIIIFLELALVSVHCNHLISCIVIVRGYRPRSTANTTADTCLLVKKDNKNNEKNVKLFQATFYHLFGCPKANSEPLERRQSHSTDVNCQTISVKGLAPKPDQEHQWESTSNPSNSECKLLSQCVTLLESVLETIDHCLPSFFSKIYRSFSLTLNTFHTLSHCYYSNFKQVNVGCEVHHQLFVRLIQECQHTCVTIHRLK